MKKINILVLVSAISLLVGCGGGSGSPSNTVPAGVDNSAVTNLQNQYGYFGNDVKFGDYKISEGVWTLFDEVKTDRVVMTFRDDGSFKFRNGNYDYGISKDGTTIKSDVLNDIQIRSTKKDLYEVTSLGGVTSKIDCYVVSGGDIDLIMCPAHIIF